MRESDTKNRGSRRSPELYDRLGKGQYERKKNSRGTKAWPCVNLHGALAMGRERDSLVFFRCHNKATQVSCSTAPPPSGVPATTFQPRGSILLQKAHCAAMLDAACCDDHRSALSRRMHRVAFSGPTFSVCSQSGPYGSTRPGTPTLQSRSCILHILFHWGKEHNRRFRAFLSIVQRKLSKSPTSDAPLLKEDSTKCLQVSVLCPKKFYKQSARSASLPQAIFLSVKAKPLETGKAGGLPNLGWVCHRLIAILPHPARRNPSAKATGRESKRIYLVPKRSDCELMRAASSK